jgi:hypothetical protein
MKASHSLERSIGTIAQQDKDNLQEKFEEESANLVGERKVARGASRSKRSSQ